MPQHLLVYGSLRPEFDNDFAQALLLLGERVGEATVMGVLRAFADFPGLCEGEGDVQGILYRLGPSFPQALLGLLDEYENFNADDPEGSLFWRAIRTVKLADGSEVSAWVYFFNRDPLDAPVVESGDWLAHVRAISGRPGPVGS